MQANANHQSPKQPALMLDVLAGFASLCLTMGIARFAYTALLPPMLEGMQWSASEGGFLAAINFAGYLIGAVTAGLIRNPAHMRTLYRLGMITALITTSLAAWIEPLWLWVPVRFLSGMSSTAGMVLGTALLLARLLETGKSHWLGWHYAGVGAGLALCTLAIMLSIGQATWQEQWALLGLISLPLTLMSWRLGRSERTGPEEKKATPETVSVRKSGLPVLLFSYFTAGFCFAIPGAFLVAAIESIPALGDFGLWSWLVVGLAAAPSTILWITLSIRFGERKIILAAYTIQALGALLPALSSSMIATLLGALCYGLTFMGIVALMMRHVGTLSPQNPARFIGPMTGAYGIGQITGPLLTGYLTEFTGTYLTGFLIAAILIMVGATALLLLWSRQQRAQGA